MKLEEALSKYTMVCRKIDKNRYIVAVNDDEGYIFDKSRGYTRKAKWYELQGYLDWEYFTDEIAGDLKYTYYRFSITHPNQTKKETQTMKIHNNLYNTYL